MEIKFLKITLSLLLVNFRIASAESLALAGDSTVATYSSSSTKQGWGASFSKYVSSKLKVSNFAKGGRTTESFRSEGHWKGLLNKKPNVIFVQFGHNDSGSKRNVPLKDYKNYLQKYIDDADAKNAEIYFVTPPHRCRFSSGKVTDEMRPYVEGMKEIAKNNGVVVLDLYKRSASFLNSQGEKACKEYFDKDDTTHFNRKGSDKMASLVAEEAKLDEFLSQFMK